MPRPGDIEIDALRRVGSSVIDAVADYHAGLDRRAVLPDVSPVEVAARFAADLPEQGESADALVEDWRTRILLLS